MTARSPLRISPNPTLDAGGRALTIDAGGSWRHVATVFGSDSQRTDRDSTAEFVVMAWNNHDALVAACEQMVAPWKTEEGTLARSVEMGKRFGVIFAALAEVRP